MAYKKTSRKVKNLHIVKNKFLFTILFAGYGITCNVRNGAKEKDRSQIAATFSGLSILYPILQ